jgi:hypothetical protein
MEKLIRDCEYFVVYDKDPLKNHILRLNSINHKVNFECLRQV